MIFGDKEMFRDLLNIINMVVVFRDVLNDLRDPAVGVVLRGVCIVGVCHGEQQLIQITAEQLLVLR